MPKPLPSSVSHVGSVSNVPLSRTTRTGTNSSGGRVEASNKRFSDSLLSSSRSPSVKTVNTPQRGGTHTNFANSTSRRSPHTLLAGEQQE